VRSGRDEAVTGYDASPHPKRIQGMAALTYSRKFAWFRPLRRIEIFLDKLLPTQKSVAAAHGKIMADRFERQNTRDGQRRQQGGVVGYFESGSSLMRTVYS
jgi:hypothetical protein